MHVIFFCVLLIFCVITHWMWKKVHMNFLGTLRSNHDTLTGI